MRQTQQILFENVNKKYNKYTVHLFSKTLVANTLTRACSF